MNLKKRIGVTHVFGECRDCGKRFENYKNGQAVAAKHAKDKGHLVTGDIGLSFRYDGRS